jgi:hypothetical protein
MILNIDIILQNALIECLTFKDKETIYKDLNQATKQHSSFISTEINRWTF